MGERVGYPSDLSDRQWALIDPFLRSWKAKRPSPSGHEGCYDLRAIVNAMFYQNRTGCQWKYLPNDLPPRCAVYYYFALWRDDGTDAAIHDLPHCQARERAGRAEDPTAVVLDTQSIRAANHVPAATTGKDAGKKVPGRKRGLAVDVLGLIIAMVVTAASATDNQIGVALLDKVVEHTPTVTQACVDAGFKDDVMIHGAVLGITVEQVKRSDVRPGFVPVAKRRVVEQTRGTLMLHRRLAREYEILPASSVSHTLWASTANLTRRLTGTSTSTSTSTRAKDVCHVLGIGTEPKDTEGVRAKLKRLVKRRILTEPEPGLFTLAAPAEPTRPPTTSSPDSSPP